MKILLSIVCIVIYNLVFSQEKKVIYTDSSKIEIEEVIKGRQSIEEYMRGKNLVKWKFVNENGITEVNGQYDTFEHSIGVWYRYDENGVLLRTENYDSRTWAVIKKEYYPYKPLIDKIKEKGDSIIIENYGIDFFRKYVKWDFSQSDIYFQNESGANWTDTTTQKPISFLLRYDIQYDNNHLYNDMIEFELNEEGNFKGNKYEEIYGFEKLPSTSQKTFMLTC